MKKLITSLVLVILMLAMTTAPAYAAKPFAKHRQHDNIVEISEDGIMMTGVMHTYFNLNSINEANGSVTYDINGLNSFQNFNVYQYDDQTGRRGDLLATISMHMRLSGTVDQGFFPDSDDPPDFIETVVDGKLTFNWHVNAFTDEIPMEGDFAGINQYWFEDGEITRSHVSGQLPNFFD